MGTSQWKINSKIGSLYLVASEKGLQGIFWKKQSGPLLRSLAGKDAACRTLVRTERELKEYFDGKRRNFSLTLDLRGTAFQKKVWKELSRIPYGKTVSYKDVANRIKNPKAMRAVGSANGENPVCIVVPCHRVIAADGSLGGYSGRRGVKRKLLLLERKRA